MKKNDSIEGGAQDRGSGLGAKKRITRGDDDREQQERSEERKERLRRMRAKETTGGQKQSRSSWREVKGRKEGALERDESEENNR
jgi:hypothetical protein